jgi:D-inositol-3-phosphate glycosyltransferase
MSPTIAMFSMHTSPLDLPGSTKDAGGMNVYMRELARALAQRNIAVDIYTRWSHPHTPRIVQLAPQVRVIHIEAGPLGVVHKNDLYQYVSSFAYNIEEFRRHEGREYDLLHSHYWLSGLTALTLSRLWDVPHVTMFHTLGRLKKLANPDEPESALRLEMEHKLIQHVDRIIASTSDERTQLIRYCGATCQQVAVVPCGVDLELFKPHNKQQARKRLGLPLHRPIVLFAGRLDPFKGPDILLRAAAIMKTRPHVVIVGGASPADKDVQQLRGLAENLGIASRVHFVGARPQQELPLYYSAADVTAVPSYHETFGLAAVESQACGTPVVATRAGGLMTVVQHRQTGFLVPRCPGFFAGHIDDLLCDTALHARMSAQCRPSVIQYSWKDIACQVEQLYNSLICVPCQVAQ